MKNKKEKQEVIVFRRTSGTLAIHAFHLANEKRLIPVSGKERAKALCKANNWKMIDES